MGEKNILLNAFDARWRRLRKEWDQTRRKYSEDSVHELRVASRRLIAVLDTLRNLLKDPVIRDCRRRVKKSLDALGPLRDVHVQRSYISTMTARYPQLEAFERSLASKEDRAARNVQKLLKRNPGFGHAMAQARRHARKRIQKDTILKFIDKRFRKVLDLEARLDQSDTQTIHNMRLAFKKFRYTCEVAQPIIKNRVGAEQLKQFRDFQTTMGDIQDIEVLSAALSKWASRNTAGQELQPVFEELKNEREKRIATFMTSVGQLHTFWKPDLKK
jgi:CHAD domain-containing protein